MLTKGLKTSELWVVILLIVSQFAKYYGMDLGAVSDGILSAQDQVAELAKQLQAEAGLNGANTTWLAMAYVVGRILLKWRELGQKNKQ